MRQMQVFSGSSHPGLADSICERLGRKRGVAELGKFSNGETSVQIHTSIRDQHVFLVQSGSNRINDDVMELLIMISACKSGSAKSTTAVLPYFPYSRMGKKKSHRGAITARMLANLMGVAGVTHVITIDLHASQMQGFFHCPVDNLLAEPILVRWIKTHIPDWREAVVVSKNPGGTKRVVSLADVLQVGFGIIMTDRKRPGSGKASLEPSVIFDETTPNGIVNGAPGYFSSAYNHDGHQPEITPPRAPATDSASNSERSHPSSSRITPTRRRRATGQLLGPSSPLGHAVVQAQASMDNEEPPQTQTSPTARRESEDESFDEGTDPRSREIVTGRLRDGHIIEDDAPSPGFSANLSTSEDDIPEYMLSSQISTTSSTRFQAQQALGGSADAVASSDEEEETLKKPDVESTVTLVGSVRDRPVFIVDDMIDRAATWIAAAETVVKKGGATQVYCFATHGLFGGDCLQEMNECDCIDHIVVTNTIQVPAEKASMVDKLTVLDVSHLLAEAIRRNHHGESISYLYTYHD